MTYRRKSVGTIVEPDSRGPLVNFTGARVRLLAYEGVDHRFPGQSLIRVEHLDSGPYWSAGDVRIVYEANFKPARRWAALRKRARHSSPSPTFCTLYGEVGFLGLGPSDYEVGERVRHLGQVYEITGVRPCSMRDSRRGDLWSHFFQARRVGARRSG